jgi:hypothetical protein
MGLADGRDVGSFDEVIEKDIELSWAIQRYVHSDRKIEEWMVRIISKNPLQDICAVVWLVAILGFIEMGWKHFWVVSSNLFFSWVLRKVIQAKRPVEYDRGLQPSTDKHSESYGFPSLESYMAIVVFGHFCIHFSSVIIFIISAPIVALIGFSRVYAKARFSHQIVGSWILGLFGLQFAHKYLESISIEEVEASMHGYFGAFVVAVVICNFAFNMESNESRLVGLTKQDYLQVLVGIMNGSSERDDDKEEGEDGEEEETGGEDTDTDASRSGRRRQGRGGEESKDTPRQVDTPRAAARSAAKRVEEDRNRNMFGYTRRDSFYFLQRNLEKRKAAQVREDAAPGMASAASSPRSTPRGVRDTPRSFGGYA